MACLKCGGTCHNDESCGKKKQKKEDKMAEKKTNSRSLSQEQYFELRTLMAAKLGGYETLPLTASRMRSLCPRSWVLI